MDAQEKAKMDKLTLGKSDMVNEKGSIFTAYAVVSTLLTEICRAYCKVRSMYTSGDHVVVAYHLDGQKGGHDDDEYAASNHLQQILNQTDKNLAIFMVCVFGGVHIGAKCFTIIEKLAREAIAKL